MTWGCASASGHLTADETGLGPDGSSPVGASWPLHGHKHVSAFFSHTQLPGLGSQGEVKKRGCFGPVSSLMPTGPNSGNLSSAEK